MSGPRIHSEDEMDLITVACLNLDYDYSDCSDTSLSLISDFRAKKKSCSKS